DRRGAGQDVRPGRDDVDDRQRGGVSLAAARDHRRRDPGGGAEILRRRRLHAGPIHPPGRRAMGHPAVTPGPVLLAVAAATPAAAQSPTQQTFDNGLLVLVRENPLARVVAISLMTEMGTRWESADNSGISNFLHAVMVKGTTKRGGGEMAEAVALL